MKNATQDKNELQLYCDIILHALFHLIFVMWSNPNLAYRHCRNYDNNLLTKITYDPMPFKNQLQQGVGLDIKRLTKAFEVILLYLHPKA